MPRATLRNGLLLVALLPALITCANDSSSPSPPSPPSRPSAAGDEPPPDVFVSSRDPSSGAPRFLWAISPGPGPAGITSPELAARAHVARYSDSYGISPSTVTAAELAHTHDTGRGGIITSLRQRADGIEVHGAEVRVLMRRDLGLVAISGGLIPTSVTRSRFNWGAGQALASALVDRYGAQAPMASDLVPDGQEDGGYDRFALPRGGRGPLRFVEPARVKRIFYPSGKKLVPAYFVELFATLGRSARSDAFRYLVSADDGHILESSDLTADAFDYRVWAEASGNHRPLDGPQADFTPHPTGLPDRSEPAFIPPRLVTMNGFNKNPSGTFDPWLAPGAVQTLGNNVDAYSDVSAPNGFSDGDLRAQVTAPGVFDRIYDVTQNPLSSPDQQMAAITQLFYVNNWLHDWFYDSGFTEAAGNAQQSNHGRGGLAGDPLLVEALDYGGRNNANMATPADGRSPRMQMFIYDGSLTQTLTLTPGTSPATRNGPYGPREFDIAADVVLANDGVAPESDACSPIQNDVADKIVLVDLGGGTCSSASRASRVQEAGGVGMIVADSVVAANPPTLSTSTSFPGPYVPTLSILQAEGTALKARLQAGTVRARMLRQIGVDRNGALDNTIISHEWGHYFHHRLARCSTHQCRAISEGWGDFNALNMVVREGDNLDGVYARPIYAARYRGDSGYFGNRRYPYSTNMSKNPLTFRNIMDSVPLPAGPPNNAGTSVSSEVHNAGELWAVSMFDVYVALLKRTATPPRTFAQTQRAMSDYMVAGLKLTPPEATYTEQRDAVLAAIAAGNSADLSAAGAAFARRGLGACAVAPADPASVDFAGVVESFETTGLSIRELKVDDAPLSCDGDGVLDVNETGQLKITMANRGTTPSGPVDLTVASPSSGLLFPAGKTLRISGVPAYGVASGTLALRLDPSVKGIQSLRLDVAAPGAVTCAQSVRMSLAVRANTDEKPRSSTIDDVESARTTWTATGPEAALVWRRRPEDVTHHHWRGAALDRASDTQLISPPLTVSATAPFQMKLKQRYDFETVDGAHHDGGVIEISDDGGASWQDISLFGTPGYRGEIREDTGNALAGRQAYVGKNAASPAYEDLSLSLGTAFAGKTVQVRFRMGTDQETGAGGWDIDDIGFEGIDNKPFATIGPNGAHTCPAGPTADAGPDQAAPPPPPPATPTSTPSPTPGPDPAPPEDGCRVGKRSSGPPLGLVITLGALGLVVLRRRQERK